jgi:two-component system, chemotaxis family, protein-glutamate methylesterase/glutaminase
MKRRRLVVIGSSWGGFHALSCILSALPKSLDAPVVVVQHRMPDSNDGPFVSYYSHRSALPVLAVEDKEPVLPGRVYIAPADYHLLVDDGHFALSTEGAVQFSRPSIDVLFESAAHAQGSAVIGVILTGANEDGAAGLSAIARCGGTTIVQDPATAERREMPEAALAATEVDEVLTLEQIPDRLVSLVETT